MASIYCIKCEQENREDATHCKACGWALQEIPVTDARPEKRRKGPRGVDKEDGWQLLGDVVSLGLVLTVPVMGLAGCLAAVNDDVAGASFMSTAALLGIMLFVLRILLVVRRRL